MYSPEDFLNAILQYLVKTHTPHPSLSLLCSSTVSCVDYQLAQLHIRILGFCKTQGGMMWDSD